jgi:hypothetical protein
VTRSSVADDVRRVKLPLQGIEELVHVKHKHLLGRQGSGVV